jgi:transposase
MRSVGLDLAAREVSMCVVVDGAVVLRRTVSRLDALDDVLGPGCDAARVVIEACREAWHVHDVLTERGHQVLVVDTTRVRQLGIGQHGRKTDRIDAETLARAAEKGSIPLAHVLTPERRRLRELLGVRRALVETRTQYITTIRGLGRGRGVSLPRCESEQFVAKLRRASLLAELEQLVAPLRAALEGIELELGKVEAELERCCAAEPLLTRLTTVPGVGLVVAASFMSVIDEAGRFEHAHQVASYLGLVPSEDTTGGRRRLGAITKKGNSYLRSLLVQAAWSALRSRGEDPLRRWGKAVQKRRGSRIAVVALARRIAGVLWAMARDATVYEPARVGMASARGLRVQAQELDVQARALERAAAKVRRRRSRRAAKEVHPTT